ncbi:MAG: hypothetical protein Q7R64_00810, partial [bacterium]|nr:hypothetical protein [bacterium]
LLGFLIVGLIAPTVFFARPKKAEALVSLTACIAAKVTAGLTSVAKTTPLALTSVMTISPAEAEIAAEAPAGNDWVSCFLKGLAKIIAKTLLHTFTQSIVNWINTGFEGSPSFVTNPEGFLNDVADQTIGRVIEDISPFLCAPFKLDIRFSLGLNLSLNSRDEIHCRLSDVIANVRGAYDGFVGGTIGSGNLSNWIHIAGTSQNNPYGAYIGTNSVISAGITSATGQQIKLLDWGKGFKSWRSCEKYGPSITDPKTGVTRKGPCIKEGPIKTPGSIIEGQTTGALATTFHELELADEIDEVVGALINQLLVQVMSAGGGLLGASKGDSSNGGFSSVDMLLTNPDAAIAGSNAVPPEGINCSLRYYPSTVEKQPRGSRIYIPDDNTHLVWTDNLGVGKTVGVTPTETRPIVPAEYVQGGNFIDINKKTTQTWEEYFTEVRAGCNNTFSRLAKNASTEGLGSFGGGGSVTPPSTPPPKSTQGTNVIEGNISQGKYADQSSIFSNDSQRFGPQNLTNGLRSGNENFGSAFTKLSPAPKWFIVDLETETQAFSGSGTAQRRLTDTEIKEIKIYGTEGEWYFRPDRDYGAYNREYPFQVYITTTDPRNSSRAQLDNPANTTVVHRGLYYLSPENGKNDLLHKVTVRTDDAGLKIDTDRFIGSIVLPSSTKGRYIYLLEDARRGTNYFGFAEVEVIGKQTRIDGTDNTGSQVTVPFSFAVSPSEPSQLDSPTPGSIFGWNGLSFLPNQSKGGLRFRAELYTCVTINPCVYKSTPEDFLNYFNSLNFRYTLDGRDLVKNAINLPSGEVGATYNTDTNNPSGGNTVVVDPSNLASGVTFADNLSVRTGSPLTIYVTGSTRTLIPFRIAIYAFDDRNVVGVVRADFRPK